MYRGNIGFSKQRNLYGDRLALLLQIDVLYTDGSRTSITSDGQWRAATGPILMSEIYHGETYDARLEKVGWDAPGFHDETWTPVRVADFPKDTLIAPAGPPVRRINELTPKEILTTPGGQHVVDMGQNMVGWVRLRVQGPAGTTVKLRHFEVLDKDGNVYLANLRSAQQTTPTRSKAAAPRHTNRISHSRASDTCRSEGYPGPLTPASLTGIVVHSAMDPMGEFTTSHAQLNQLQHNIQWGQKG